MSIQPNRLRQDALYFLQGVAGTAVVMVALTVLGTSLTLLLSAIAPGQFRTIIRDSLPPDLPLAMLVLLAGLGVLLWLLVLARFTSRQLALWTIGSLGVIALVAMLIAAIAAP